MRYYLLDDLVDPVRGEPLRVADAEVVERDGPAVERCRHWCGLRGSLPDRATTADCQRCARAWIRTGTLANAAGRYPIRDGIPRFVGADDPQVDARTQESFGFEWERFDGLLPEYATEFENYFSVVPRGLFAGAVVLDAGCGMGRWARRVAQESVRRLYVVDFSRAIERAAQTLADAPHAHCIQADVCHLPFRPASINFSYCLGVLHHLRDPDAGMRSLARVTGGALLVYLYYALDNRSRFHRAILAVVTAVRRLTSRLPKRIMLALAWIIAVLVYWPLARLARLLDRGGFARLAHEVPLSHYRSYSLRFMAGDAFDRFATPVEARYTRAQIQEWLRRYGFRASFSERTPYWVALGTPER
jgi:SAM-dependent methyltransferase